MEGLLKQARSRFSKRDERDSTREGRTTPQRTGTSKGEKAQKRFWRLSSRQMSFNKSSDEDEYAAAVAATAFAISSLEPEEADQRNMTRPQSSLPRIRSNIADTERNEMIPEKTIHPVPSPKRIPTMPRKRLSFADQVAENPALAPPSIERTPTVKKTPTFDEEFENEGRIRPPKRTPTVKKTPAFAQDTFDDAKRMNPEFSAPKPDLPPPILPPPIPPPTIQHSDRETDADIWEREHMAKIKQRYEKLNTTILEWEDDKRKKARRKLETTESELEKRRAKAMQKYQTEMEQIKQIAEGARSQAKAKQRNEELKVMEKANRYEKQNATITEWEEKKKNKEKRKLETKQAELEKKRAKAMQKYQNEMEQIKQIADGAREQAKADYTNEELKVKEKANRYRATGEVPSTPLCPCS